MDIKELREALSDVLDNYSIATVFGSIIWIT